MRPNSIFASVRVCTRLQDARVNTLAGASKPTEYVLLELVGEGLLIQEDVGILEFLVEAVLYGTEVDIATRR